MGRKSVRTYDGRGLTSEDLQSIKDYPAIDVPEDVEYIATVSI